MLERTLLCIVLIAVSSTAITEETAATKADLDAFLVNWSKHSGNLKTLQIQFRQEKHLKVLRRPLISSGTVRLAGGKLECVVRDRKGETDSILFIDKESMRIFYPRLKRLEVYDLTSSNAPATAFPIFGSDPERLKRDYAIELVENGERRTLTLTPRDKNALVGAMTLVFKDLEIEEVEQRNRRGDRVRMFIERFERNPDMDPSQLKLEVPAGTKTERPLARRSTREARDG